MALKTGKNSYQNSSVGSIQKGENIYEALGNLSWFRRLQPGHDVAAICWMICGCQCSPTIRPRYADPSRNVWVGHSPLVFIGA